MKASARFANQKCIKIKQTIVKVSYQRYAIGKSMYIHIFIYHLNFNLQVVLTRRESVQCVENKCWIPVVINRAPNSDHYISCT
jgi:hypothetical protein